MKRSNHLSLNNVKGLVLGIAGECSRNHGKDFKVQHETYTKMNS